MSSHLIPKLNHNLLISLRNKLKISTDDNRLKKEMLNLFFGIYNDYSATKLIFDYFSKTFSIKDAYSLKILKDRIDHIFSLTDTPYNKIGKVNDLFKEQKHTYKIYNIKHTEYQKILNHALRHTCINDINLPNNQNVIDIQLNSLNENSHFITKDKKSRDDFFKLSAHKKELFQDASPSEILLRLAKVSLYQHYDTAPKTLRKGVSPAFTLLIYLMTEQQFDKNWFTQKINQLLTDDKSIQNDPIWKKIEKKSYKLWIKKRQALVKEINDYNELIYVPLKDKIKRLKENGPHDLFSNAFNVSETHSTITGENRDIADENYKIKLLKILNPQLESIYIRTAAIIGNSTVSDKHTIATELKKAWPGYEPEPD